jgi:glucose/mannose-6-phosphate isomerase
VLVTHRTLDDPASIDAVDRSGMLAVVADLGRQLRTGFEAGRGAAGLPDRSEVSSVVVCGMGGSGIAGDVVRSLHAGAARVPIAVWKAYGLPGWCAPGTLVVAVSYSGNTEETLSSFDTAIDRGAFVVAISSGGALAKRASDGGPPHVAVSSDVGMPRAAVGYLAGAALGVLEGAGLAPSVEDALDSAAALADDLSPRLGPDRPIADNEGKELALWLAGRVPVIWASDGVAEAAALRWKNQMNENAKIPAWCSVLPELDHNEIEGWGPGTGAPFGLVVLRRTAEDPHTAERVEASLDAVRGSGLSVRQVWAEGASPLENLFSLMMKADFASIYLAVLRGVDPTPVPVLMGLKERLRS